MRKTILLMMVIGVFLSGCKKEEGKEEKPKDTMEVMEAKREDKNEKRALAMTGEPNEEGYYLIDLPKSAEDLYSLEQINSRLYSIAMTMEKKNIKSFKEISDEAAIEAAVLDAAFNGSNSELYKDIENGRILEISKKTMEENIKQAFKREKPISFKKLPKGVEDKGESLWIYLEEIEARAYGFVMNEYKRSDNLWHIRGEIMTSGASTFVRGEFVLEENDPNSIISHQIVSFTEETNQ